MGKPAPEEHADPRGSTKPGTRSLDDVVSRIYGCDESPLAFMIEPMGTVKITGKDEVTRPEELASILDA